MNCEPEQEHDYVYRYEEGGVTICSKCHKRKPEINWYERTKELEAKLAEAQEQAFRSGYEAGSTAVNTIGPEALGHCGWHFKLWMEEK